MTARRIPGRAVTCTRCKATMVWARTMATESGAGGKAMPLDPLEDLAGNVAVRPVNDRGGLVARVLKKDETHDRVTEYLAMPHFKSCTPPDPQLPIESAPNVLDFVAARRARGARRG